MDSVHVTLFSICKVSVEQDETVWANMRTAIDDNKIKLPTSDLSGSKLDPDLHFSQSNGLGNVPSYYMDFLFRLSE